MATGGDDSYYSIESEDFYDCECGPYQEDGELLKAMETHIDFEDHLYQNFNDGQKLSKLSRKHELLDKETMLQGQVLITKDKCTEKCTVHEDKVIEYYCMNHSYVGCRVCISLDHRTCDSVRYIPHVAKDLANNEEYQQVESHLIAVLERSEQLTEHNQQNNESLIKECLEAENMVQKFIKDINEHLDKAESDLLQHCEAIKSEETAKIEQIVDTFKTTQTELHALMDKKETYENIKHYCNLYKLLMKTKDKVKLAEEMIKEAEREQSHTNTQIKFLANKETLKALTLPETHGKLLASGTPRTLTSNISKSIRPDKTKALVRQKRHTGSVKKVEKLRIIRGEYVHSINVQIKTDDEVCYITGLVILPDNRLVTTDYYNNRNVKLVDAKHSQVITCLTLSSAPYDITMITQCQVAITMPDKREVAMVYVTATDMTVKRTLDVDGECRGVDYRYGKLAVSFRYPNKVQIITLQGRVLHSIITDQQGHDLFNTPGYVVFGQDNSSLYVYNFYSNKVVNVKFDGTVVGTYTDTELRHPHASLTDSSDHVYVCGEYSNNIHQIAPDCRKVTVLLTEADGLYYPMCISYSETDCRLYVGMQYDNVVKVYSLTLGFK